MKVVITLTRVTLIVPMLAVTEFQLAVIPFSRDRLSVFFYISQVET